MKDLTPVQTGSDRSSPIGLAFVISSIFINFGGTNCQRWPEGSSCKLFRDWTQALLEMLHLIRCRSWRAEETDSRCGSVDVAWM
jgi:hypothetical protein